MPPRKKKKPQKPGEAKLPRRPHGKLEPSGRSYEGPVVARCLIPPARVAVWDVDAKGPDDDPVVCGVLLGIQPHRDGRVPDLRVAINERVESIALDRVGDMCALRSDQATPTEDDR